MVNILDYFKKAPNFNVWHSYPDQDSEILITAGMHGDELSSIEAAKHLIKTYRGDTPITVVPILNLEGYQAGVSYNPLDNKDPIYLYPGSRFGSSTAQLMFRLAKVATHKKIWIDLHGGAKGEYLKPFIWAPKEYPILSYLKGRILVEPTYQKDLPYLLLEAGELGKINQTAIAQHLSWVDAILKNFGRHGKPSWRPTYNQIVYDQNIGQDRNVENFLWSSPTYYISGKIA